MNWQGTDILLASHCHPIGKSLPFQWQGAANCNGKALPMQLAKSAIKKPLLKRSGFYIHF